MMKVLSIEGLMIKEVTDVSLEISQNQGQFELKIKATGFALAVGWSKPTLELRSYDFPPVDGIYEFDFKGQAPEGLMPNALEKMLAHYRWTNYPKDLKGVRIHAGENSILKML